MVREKRWGGKLKLRAIKGVIWKPNTVKISYKYMKVTLMKLP